jgi:hypothetical protein
VKFSPWPRSLFGRLLGVLAVGLVVAQGLSAWINWAERDRVLLEAAGMQPVQPTSFVCSIRWIRRSAVASCGS